jgi:demethylmenaquinone methyltransferase/2-methoxy-6-polyprenyl-1,4-benzoquinol methylase
MEPDRRRLLLDIYKRRAATYDRGLALAQRLRLWPRTHHQAVARLSLEPGDVVLDVGCGTGLSFPFIEAQIGSEGRLVGIDLSPDMLAKARERVESSGWQNVTLIESAIEEADIPVAVDAVLFHFVGEVLRSRQALENIFRHVKAGGRVAAAGTKRAPWWAFPLNLYVWFFARRFGRPRAHLVRFVPDLTVEPVIMGGVYIAWGTVPRE